MEVSNACANQRSDKTVTVFVIEDEDSIRALLATFLERASFEVLTARDAPEARAVWSQNASAVGLLVADLILPGGNGFELAQEFRKNRPDLKIIFASGNPRNQLLETTQLIKGSKMILKPFSMTQFLDVVSDILEKN